MEASFCRMESCELLVASTPSPKLSRPGNCTRLDMLVLLPVKDTAGACPAPRESACEVVASQAKPAALDEAACRGCGLLLEDSRGFVLLLSLLGRSVVFILDRLSGLGVLEVFGSTTGAGFGDNGCMLVEEVLRAPISGL